MRKLLCMSGIVGSGMLLSGCAVCQTHPYACSTALALAAGSAALAARGSDDQTHSLREPVNNNYPPRIH